MPSYIFLHSRKLYFTKQFEVAGNVACHQCISTPLMVLFSSLLEGYCGKLFAGLSFAQVMREVAWVVFDEIHYMRDKGILFEIVMC